MEKDKVASVLNKIYEIAGHLDSVLGTEDRLANTSLALDVLSIAYDIKINLANVK